MHPNVVSLCLACVAFVIFNARYLDSESRTGEQPLSGVVASALRAIYFVFGVVEKKGWPSDTIIFLTLFAYVLEAAAPTFHAVHSKKRAMTILTIVVCAGAVGSVDLVEADFVATVLVGMALITLYASTPDPVQDQNGKLYPAFLLFLFGGRLFIHTCDIQPSSTQLDWNYAHLLDFVAIVISLHSVLRDAVSEDDM